MAAKAASNESVDGRMIACNDKRGQQKTTQQPTSKGISKSGQWWEAMTVTLRRDSNASATVMDGDRQCNDYMMATMGMERGGNGDVAPTSNGHHRGMLACYSWASMHFKLSSFWYKYAPPPTACGTASPTPAPYRPWTCVILIAHQGTCPSSTAYRSWSGGPS